MIYVNSSNAWKNVKPLDRRMKLNKVRKRLVQFHWTWVQFGHFTECKQFIFDIFGQRCYQHVQANFKAQAIGDQNHHIQLKNVNQRKCCQKSNGVFPIEWKPSENLNKIWNLLVIILLNSTHLPIWKKKWPLKGIIGVIIHYKVSVKVNNQYWKHKILIQNIDERSCYNFRQFLGYLIGSFINGFRNGFVKP